MEERRSKQWRSQVNEDAAPWSWGMLARQFEFVDFETISR